MIPQLFKLTTLFGYLDCFPQVLNLLVQLALGVVVCKNLKDGVGIEDSSKGFVDLVLDLGCSVNPLLVVVLCLVDGIQLKKESCLKETQNMNPTFFTSSICFWAVVTCVWSVWHFSANVFQFPALFCNKQKRRLISLLWLESDQLTLRSSSLFFAVVVVFSHSAFISLSFSPRKPLDFFSWNSMLFES